jgi:hypothetical protein
MPSPNKRAFTPVFDGLRGEGAAMRTAFAVINDGTSHGFHRIFFGSTGFFSIACSSAIVFHFSTASAGTTAR